jgi:hypothetical protein
MKGLKSYNSSDKKSGKKQTEVDLGVAWSWDCLQLNSLGRTELVGDGFTNDRLLKFARYIHALIQRDGTDGEKYAVFLLRDLTVTCRYLGEMGY